ncbi:MAG: glycosyltransferase family 2 protein [Segetibacter sp.]|nr:glycosyltransferase family 2 protein [Segetibacter sp.]
MTDLSIIIVNHNSANLIIDCLRSVYQFTRWVNFEIIVVDNSNDTNKAEVLRQFSNVCWIDMNYNAGFARANNAGIRISKGEVVLLLNPDTIVIDNTIADCYNRLQQTNYIAAGVQLLDINNQPQISGSFFVKGGLNHLLPIPYWGSFIRWLGYKTKRKIPNVQKAKDVEEVDWISGAFLMVKKQAIENAGLLNEDFFLYAEEVEWCSRLKKAGKLCIFGNLHIIHLEGATINKSENLEEKGYYNLYDKKGLQLMVSNHVRVRKQYGTGWFLILLLNFTLGLFIYFVCSFFYRLLTLKNPFKEWKKVAAFANNVWKLWQLSPIIISNKPYFYKML